jgi:dipeptidyl aminopeptidase/acylaminoacyl peptidase
MSSHVARRWSRPGILGAIAPLALIMAFSTSAFGQTDTRVVRANWQLAERFTNAALRPALFSLTLTPRWIGKTDSLWYSWRDRKGTRFMLVAPKARTKRPLFDHVKFASDLSALHRKPYEAHDLPMTSLRFAENGRSFRFVLDSIRYEYDLPSATLRRLERMTREQMERDRAEAQQGQGGGGGGGQFGGGNPNADFRNYSPDSTAFVFAREHNLYIVEVARGDTVQLTTDGERWYSFGARDTALQRQQQELQQLQRRERQEDEQEEQGDRQQQVSRSRDPRVRVNVTWSPDSRAFSVMRTDSRKVSELYLVNVMAQPRPALISYRYAMPGEENVPQQELWVYRRGDRELVKAPVEKYRDQRLFDIHWPAAGSDRLRLVRRDRLQRNLELIDWEIASNSVRVVLTESTENGYLERQNARYLKAGGDFVWWSERTGWGHLYLYGQDGTLKTTLTSGPWRVDQLVDVDTVKRFVYFRGVGRESGENVYFRHLYRINADGAGLALLDPGNANHTSALSPSKRFAVDNFSRIDMPGQAVVRDERGAILMELEQADISALLALGWKPPEEFMVKAADGITDIYGVMWKPFDFDPTRKYPIVAHVYPGPQTETVTTTFSPNNNNQRLAQLGFIVIQIGNRGGSPARSNAYHSYGYYNLRDYGLADKKSGIEQLAARHSFIDINRVGMYGHSGGGFMTAAALLQKPYNEFFKVGVSSAGNHDNNVYNQNWSEQHHGLREVRVPRKVTTEGQNGNGSAEEIQEEEIKFDIEVPANHELAENLKGRLLLVHGDLDNNVHPAGTIRLANALIRANKRFDFFIMPGQAHGFGPMQDYFTRLMHEYFAEHLMGDYYRTGADIR